MTNMEFIPCPTGRCERGAYMRTGQLDDFGYCGRGAKYFVIMCNCFSSHPQTTEAKARELWAIITPKTVKVDG